MKKVCNRHYVAFEARDQMCTYCWGEQQEQLRATVDELKSSSSDEDKLESVIPFSGEFVSISYDANGMYLDQEANCDHD